MILMRFLRWFAWIFCIDFRDFRYLFSRVWFIDFHEFFKTLKWSIVNRILRLHWEIWIVSPKHFFFLTQVNNIFGKTLEMKNIFVFSHLGYIFFEFLSYDKKCNILLAMNVWYSESIAVYLAWLLIQLLGVIIGPAWETDLSPTCNCWVWSFDSNSSKLAGDTNPSVTCHFWVWSPHFNPSRPAWGTNISRTCKCSKCCQAGSFLSSPVQPRQFLFFKLLGQSMKWPSDFSPSNNFFWNDFSVFSHSGLSLLLKSFFFCFFSSGLPSFFFPYPLWQCSTLSIPLVLERTLR